MSSCIENWTEKARAVLLLKHHFCYESRVDFCVLRTKQGICDIDGKTKRMKKVFQRAEEISKQYPKLEKWKKDKKRKTPCNPKYSHMFCTRYSTHSVHYEESSRRGQLRSRSRF